MPRDGGMRRASSYEMDAASVLVSMLVARSLPPTLAIRRHRSAGAVATILRAGP